MDRRDDLLYNYIDFIAGKIKFQKKMLTRTGRDRYKYKLEAYEEIYNDLLNTLNAYKKIAD